MREISLGRSILAPMAGITGYPFRKICLKYGAEFSFTEMISAEGFLRNDKKTLELLEAGSGISKTGIQLFGNSAAVLSEAAKKAFDQGFKVIDINAGCPVKKVVKTGAGSALLKDSALFADIAASVRKSVKDAFFTVKFRSGFDFNSVNFVEIGKIAEDSGINALFFHPRTRSQMFGGTADHSQTKKLKELVSIPVYASGDIFTADDALNTMSYTGADGIMFARGAAGKPWIFRDYANISDAGGQGQTEKKETDMTDKIDILLELNEEISSFYGETRGCNIIKPHLYNFLKGFKGSKELRASVNSAKSGKETDEILKMLRTQVASNEYSESAG
ncbi:MAG: tRNA dihydrouridine synthase DusB [Deltaproteobacteria bacterium]|jgi:nifR3 family TIM-barrel protein|nr:tRNA dihydrouridine synthase DusB [Deltaproteobacteria bacterium]